MGESAIKLNTILKKFRSDLLFTGNAMLSDSVLVTKDDGTILDIVPQKDAGENVACFEGIITPGFINCHCHIELSHLHQVIHPKSGLVNFLIEVVKQRNRIDLEKILISIEAVSDNLQKEGIVAVGDICNTDHTIKMKSRSPIHFYNFIEVFGFSNQFTEERLQTMMPVVKEFMDLKTTNRNSYVSMVPHAPYSVSEVLFSRLNQISSGKVITIHNQEGQAENELYLSGSGEFFNLFNFLKLDVSFFTPTKLTSLQSYFPLLNKAQHLLLVHNTYTSQQDIDFIQNAAKDNPFQKVYWCLCPNANLYIENKLPPISLLLDNNCDIVLGTDSLASNKRLSMLDEIKTVLQDNQNKVNTLQVLQWATIQGARALQLDSILGSFAPGKKPGILLLNHIQNGQITDKTELKVLA